MAPLRIALLSTLCAALMCCAGAVQLIGIDRIMVTEGSAHAGPPMFASPLAGTVEPHFTTDSFPLER